MRKAIALMTMVVAASVTVRPQALTFEVASVKPNRSADTGASFGVRPGGQLVVRNNTLWNIIRNVWDVQAFQMTGGPEWVDKDRFDITATSPLPNPTIDQFREMARALLADRFGLVVRRETREMPVYALVLARADGRPGPRMTQSTTDCEAVDASARRGVPPPQPAANGRPACGTRGMPGRMLAGGVTMTNFARNLSVSAGRVVVDKTGLTGGFDLELDFLPDQLPPEGSLPPGLPRPSADAPSLFAALQEQLGLKLEARRAPVDVLVIEAASQPTPD